MWESGWRDVGGFVNVLGGLMGRYPSANVLLAAKAGAGESAVLRHEGHLRGFGPSEFSKVESF